MVENQSFEYLQITMWQEALTIPVGPPGTTRMMAARQTSGIDRQRFYGQDAWTINIQHTRSALTSSLSTQTGHSSLYSTGHLSPIHTNGHTAVAAAAARLDRQPFARPPEERPPGAVWSSPDLAHRYADCRDWASKRRPSAKRTTDTYRLWLPWLRGRLKQSISLDH